MTRRLWFDAVEGAPPGWAFDLVLTLVEAGGDARVIVRVRCGREGKNGYCGSKAGIVVATRKGPMYFAQRPARAEELSPSFRATLQEEVEDAKRYRAGRADHRGRQWRPTPVVRSQDLLLGDVWHPEALLAWCSKHGTRLVDRPALLDAVRNKRTPADLFV